MKAAVCHEQGKPLTIEDVVLRDPGQGEVRVKVGAVAICHSDLGFLDGVFPCPTPAILGHEAAGTIVSLGDGVHGLAVGDRVVVTLIRACGQCRPCVTGKPYLCATPYKRGNGVLTMPDGTVVEHGLNTGAFAEEVVVHASQVVKVAEDLPMDLGALLACGVITGTGAVINTAQVEAGSTVVIIGAGGVGLNAVQGARLSGASKIIAIDISDAKLDAAREFGATDTLRADMEGLRKAVRKLTDGGADYVFVTVGAIAAYQGATGLAARGGTVVAVGMPAVGAKMELEPQAVAVTAQTVKGSFMGGAVIQRDIPYLVDLWRQGRLNLEDLVSERFRFDQINEALDSARAGNARRNVIIMDT